MTTFEKVLEEALARLGQGQSAEQAAAGFPELQERLLPLLAAAEALRRPLDAAAEPTAEFKQRGRMALLSHMAAKPRAAGAPGASLPRRYATAFAALVLALATATTAMAQSALPGHALYGIKLVSERVWRSVHFNPIYVDLELSDRRLDELLAVQSDSARAATALSAYASSLDQLQRDLAAMPNKARSAREIIVGQKEQVRAVIEASGSSADQFFTIIPSLDELIEKNPQQVPVVVPGLPVAAPSLLAPLRDNTGKSEDQKDSAVETEGDPGAPDSGPSLLDTAKNAVDDLLQGLP